MRFTAIAPILLKNIANPFGNSIRQRVEDMAVIMARLCQIEFEINRPLKLIAVKIPQTAVNKNNPKQIREFILSSRFFKSHEIWAFELLIFTPRLATTPCKCPIP